MKETIKGLLDKEKERQLAFKNKYSIAVIAGDGIGKEVMPEGLRALGGSLSKIRH